MKQLTDESKIHLATKVMELDYVFEGSVGEDSIKGFSKREEAQIINIKDFNPNNLDTPFAGKYLRDLILAFEKKPIDNRFTLNGWSLEIINEPENIIEFILLSTGFKGEIWIDEHKGEE